MAEHRCWGDDICDLEDVLTETDLGDEDRAENIGLALRELGWVPPSLHPTAAPITINITTPSGLDVAAVAKRALAHVIRL